MIASHLALLTFALAAAVAIPAFADAPPLRPSRRLGEFRDEEDLAAAVQGDKKLGDYANAALIEPAVGGDHHGDSGSGGSSTSGSKYSCQSGDKPKTCDIALHDKKGQDITITRIGTDSNQLGLSLCPGTKTTNPPSIGGAMDWP